MFTPSMGDVEKAASRQRPHPPAKLHQIALDDHCNGVSPCKPREQFIMPLLLGSLCDHSGRPWFQSSIYEFLPAVEGIKTTNIGGKPMFKANLRPGQIRSQPAVQMNAALN
ncbi:hypothetical protein SH139x_002698 [Planctomycetaceae bacterium SH139]